MALEVEIVQTETAGQQRGLGASRQRTVDVCGGGGGGVRCSRHKACAALIDSKEGTLFVIVLH